MTADLDLTRKIRTIYAASRKIYGAPRIHAELKSEGVAIGKKRVARLMGAARLVGVTRRRSVTTTRRDPDHRPANDLVRTNFFAEKPNELWVADITFVPTLRGVVGSGLKLVDSGQGFVQERLIMSSQGLQRFPVTALSCADIATPRLEPILLGSMSANGPSRMEIVDDHSVRVPLAMLQQRQTGLGHGLLASP